MTPAGDEVTVPLPVPAFTTDNANVPPAGTKGEIAFPLSTVCAMPGPAHETATLSPPVASLRSTSM